MILTKFEKYFYKAEKSFIVLLEKKNTWLVILLKIIFKENISTKNILSKQSWEFNEKIILIYN